MIYDKSTDRAQLYQQDNNKPTLREWTEEQIALLKTLLKTDKLRRIGRFEWTLCV